MWDRRKELLDEIPRDGQQAGADEITARIPPYAVRPMAPRVFLEFCAMYGIQLAATVLRLAEDRVRRSLRPRDTGTSKISEPRRASASSVVGGMSGSGGRSVGGGSMATTDPQPRGFGLSGQHSGPESSQESRFSTDVPGAPGGSTNLNRLQGMDGDTSGARIYLLDESERQVTRSGHAIVSADGDRQELPPLVYQALQQVIEVLSTGQAVKITAFRTELPIDEAAYAIDMRSDDLRAYVAEGAIPFRSTEYVDWVRLADVIEWDRERRRRRREGVQRLLDEGPWEEDGRD